MKYRVRHTTQYSYGEPVALCHNVVHLHPRDTERQMCHRWELAVDPPPEVLRHQTDFFGNHAVHFSLQEPHQGLKIEAQSEVEVRPLQLAQGCGPTWDDAVRSLACRPDASTLDASQYTFDSPYVARHADLVAYASPSFPEGRPLIEAVLDLTTRIFRDFKYDSGSTTVDTPVLEVLRHRRGVCQDFAHLQIGCLRSLGLPARYVSGYLLTRPAGGKPRLVGTDASHAWLAAYVPSVGWVDFDPTNGVIPSLDHVTVAWARDYDDISPVRGVITGGQKSALSVAVHVEPVDSTAE